MNKEKLDMANEIFAKIKEIRLMNDILKLHILQVNKCENKGLMIGNCKIVIPILEEGNKISCKEYVIKDYILEGLIECLQNEKDELATEFEIL